MDEGGSESGGRVSTRITVCVPTRNRGSSIGPTLQSLARLDHGDFRVIVVDQSTDDRTRRTYQEMVGEDQRFSYISTPTIGASIARNIAAGKAEGSIIAYIDDDCVVTPHWLDEMDRAFGENPRAKLVCGAVISGDHDPSTGAVPAFVPTSARLHTSAWAKYRARGIGANLALDADVLRRVGPFDEALGPGGALGGCEDGDMVYRVLRAGYGVLDCPDAAVVHNGFRTWPELRTLGRRALLGCGLVCMKHLRLGDPKIIPTLIFLWSRRTIRWGNVARLRRPVGLALFIGFTQGMLRGLRHPVDRRTRTYVLRDRRPAATQPVDASAAAK